MIDRVIAAICEHVIAEEALAGGDEGIGIDEAANLWIVITGLQVIEAGIILIGSTLLFTRDGSSPSLPRN